MSHPPPHPSRRTATARLLAAAGAVLIVITAVAACGPPLTPPSWPSGQLTATVKGPLVHLQWPAATPAGGLAVASYGISANGAIVAEVPASNRSCLVTGLAASTTYQLKVTAKNSAGQWSNTVSGAAGYRTASATTPANGRSGSALACVAATDGDADSLPDAFENDTATYLDATRAGTDPAVADTDGDGISDGDETLGRPGLDLIAMGARPVRKDLMLEIDWMSHAPCRISPVAAGLNPVRSAFANAPVSNPNGVGGINLVVDHGQGGAFTGGSQILDDNGDGKVAIPGTPAFDAIKEANVAAARFGIFRYSVVENGGGGLAAPQGDDTTVGYDCGLPDADARYARLLMHELGHNLGLGHGGGPAPDGEQTFWDETVDPPRFVRHRDMQLKPNYVSIMNNAYGTVHDACDRRGLGWPQRLDYSTGWRASLDERALDESVGVCNGVPWDFNDNGVIDAGVYAMDLTDDGVLSPLHDHDDWGFIEREGLADLG